MDIIGKRFFYFVLSLIVMIPGLISLFLFGLKGSIDFTGGSRLSFVFEKKATDKNIQTVKNVFQKAGHDAQVQPSGNTLFVRTKPLDQKTHETVLKEIKGKVGQFKEENFETVGPTIGQETTWNAVKAILLASLLIVLYIAWSFRSVPKPASSFRFGICAVLALVHDVIVVVGVFSLLGHFYHVEIDSLFVTALLTVVGFSVHDTIVVFDRIRETLRRMPGANFPEVVNQSILQTLGRSLNTSLTVLLVLVTLLFFGGESVRWFVVALLVGIISGTYSSIFNAAPLLVTWEEWSRKRKK